ncbi:MAG: nitroreductase family deazaflavin-dependent oxidoreductase [Solirubrobacteraceae bacterium]|nr:nitroreductase family deazaflavin-dependent oxidoreductase [Solirubrobacteraceae bacterium]
MLFGAEHVQRYRETDGREGHDWQGTTVLILTTTGRRSGEPRSTPLIYRPIGEQAYAIAASNGGGDPPRWYLNLVDRPEAVVQVRDDEFPARAREANATDRPALWDELVATWPAYADYQAKADREIPVILLERDIADAVD